MRATTKQAVQEVVVVCPNCKAQNKLEACVKEQQVDQLMEGGMECPDCGQWTHSYWKNQDLIARAERLEEVRQLFHAKQTDGRWQNYQTMKEAYARAFESFQEKMKGKLPRKEEQLA